jgi:hypothetical protein
VYKRRRAQGVLRSAVSGADVLVVKLLVAEEGDPDWAVLSLSPGGLVCCQVVEWR